MQMNFATYQEAANVTPSDTIDTAFRALFVGGAGNVKLTTAAGNTLTITGVTAGSVLPIEGTRVWNGSTTATNMVALR